MQKLLVALLVVHAGYVTYLVKQNSDTITRQQQENLALTQQLENVKNAAP